MFALLRCLKINVWFFSFQAAIVMLKKVLFLLLVVFYGSHQQCLTPNDTPEFAGSPRFQDWLASQHNFSVSLMQALNKQRNGKDIVFSPVSIHELLLLLYFGAGDGTEKSLMRVLQIPFLQARNQLNFIFLGRCKSY